MTPAPKSRASFNVCRMLTAAVIATVGASLPACESALSSDNGPENSGRYAESLLAHAIREGVYAGPMIQTSTFNGGVRELPRVDEPGPGGTPGATTISGAASSATQPAASQPIAEVGLAAATLNMPEPVFNLSLQDAIARAVAHSVAIKVEAYNPAIKESLITQAESAFDPVVFGSSDWINNDDPTRTGGNINGQTWQNQIGLRRLLPSGATVQAAANINYRDATSGNLISSSTGSTSLSTSHQSNYSSNIALQITQPLLRGFGADVAQANIYLAQKDLRISLATFRKQVMTSVADVEEAYHNLVLARTTVDIFQRVLKISEQTSYMIQQRPDGTQASIYQALSAVATRRADLYRAVSNYRVASDNLKGLLNDPEIDIRSNILINPTDKPITEPIDYNVADCIYTALNQRPEIQAARLQMEKTDIVVKVAKNDLLPKLDLSLLMQSNGQGDAIPTASPGTPVPTPPRSLDQAFSSIVNPMNSIDWSAGIKLEFPLGNRFAEAQLVQRKSEQSQAVEIFMQTALDAVKDVKEQLRNVLSFYGEIRYRDDVRTAAAGELEGIINIEEIRPRTPEFLQLELDSQARLAIAEQNEIEAIVRYNIAVMKLEQAKGTLLEFNRISLNKPPPKPADDDFGKLFFLGKSVLPP